MLLRYVVALVMGVLASAVIIYAGGWLLFAGIFLLLWSDNIAQRGG